MSRGNNYPPIVAGFIEGLFAPVVELVVGVIITSLTAASSAMGALNMTGLIALISIVDILRNILSCLLHTQFAIGNVMGNIFGIVFFYGAISYVSSEAANSSLLLTIILAISLLVGVVITIWRRSEESSY
jgi:hypothetical protein